MRRFLELVTLLSAIGPVAVGMPALTIPAEIRATFPVPVEVPVVFDSGGAPVSTILFSVDLDELCLAFDPTDADLDGQPDAIVFDLPPAFAGLVSFDPLDLDGELDFTIVDPLPPLSTVPDGAVVSMTLTPLCDPVRGPILAPLLFSGEPPVSFGDSNGQSISGTSSGGSVLISYLIFGDGFESGDTSEWTETSPRNRPQPQRRSRAAPRSGD